MRRRPCRHRLTERRCFASLVSMSRWGYCGGYVGRSSRVRGLGEVRSVQHGGRSGRLNVAWAGRTGNHPTHCPKRGESARGLGPPSPAPFSPVRVPVEGDGFVLLKDLNQPVRPIRIRFRTLKPRAGASRVSAQAVEPRHDQRGTHSLPVGAHYGGADGRTCRLGFTLGVTDVLLSHRVGTSAGRQPADLPVPRRASCAPGMGGQRKAGPPPRLQFDLHRRRRRFGRPVADAPARQSGRAGLALGWPGEPTTTKQPTPDLIVRRTSCSLVRVRCDETWRVLDFNRGRGCSPFRGVAGSSSYFDQKSRVGRSARYSG